MSKHAINSISVADLDRLLESDPELELIDVRPREMYDARRVQQARFVEFKGLDPKATMEKRKRAAPDPLTTPLYVICEIGVRSVKACEIFIDAGFNNVVNIKGGTRAWAKADFPVIGVTKGFACPMWMRFKKLNIFKSKKSNAA